MIDDPSVSSSSQIVSDARTSVSECRSRLQVTLQAAESSYRTTLQGLSSPDSSEPTLLSVQMETLQRSQSLQRKAGELEGALTRLKAAIASVDEADELLSGLKRPGSVIEEASETSLEAVAMQAQEEERYRLAREIHDGPAQILANVALQLEYISKLAVRDPAKARDEMVTIQRDLRLAVGEVRRFMYDLRPPALALHGVGAAVESHCQRLGERFGLEISVEWQASTPLLPNCDTAVFRIVQEALQNVVKHAVASRIEVRAAEVDGRLEISVADNGRGFDLEQIHRMTPDHFGLSGMRARAQQISAGLDLTSAPGQGTTVFLRVPLS